jgi:hypothetical protein
MKAEILDTGNPKIAGARIVINRPASELFDFIANPKNHPKSMDQRWFAARLMDQRGFQ